MNITKGIGSFDSSGTVDEVEVSGMSSLLNVGPEEVFISVNDEVVTTKAETDGVLWLPVNIPVPLPRSLRKFKHKTASATAKVLVITDVK